jgi:simple sugar transport system permease protein
MAGRLKFTLEKRQDVGLGQQLWALVAALFASLIVMAILLILAGANISEGFAALYQGAFGNWQAFVATLVKATPLILTGLATTIAFRGRIWNIGVEGQLYAGAIAAYWASTTFDSLPQVALFFVILFAGIVGGALWASIASVIKVKFEVNEIISTVLLNYIILYLLSWLLSGPWRDPESYYQHSPEIAETSQFWVILDNSRLHIGFVVALVAAVLVYLIVERTPLGYEIRAFGKNPLASKFQGTNIALLVIIIMLISGGIAGLAGTGELFGIHHRLKSEISLGYGFTGIIIAMLAGLHPLAVVPTAILFSGLINGSFMLQITTGVPSSLVVIIQAVVLLFLLAARAVLSYRVRRVGVDESVGTSYQIRNTRDA